MGSVIENHVPPYAYLPPAQRDTRYGLWYKMYKIRVANIQARSVEDVIENGFYTSGEEDFDHMANWHREVRMVNVVRMATLWIHKANVFLVNEADSKAIYEDISAHLTAWRLHLTGSYNQAENAPVEDLLHLDQFASQIYEHAKWHFDDNWTSRLLGSRKLLRFSRRNDDEVHRRMLIARELREEKERGNKDNIEVNNFKLTIVANGERQQPDTDFSNKPRYDTSNRSHRSMVDYLKK